MKQKVTDFVKKKKKLFRWSWKQKVSRLELESRNFVCSWNLNHSVS